MYSAAAKHKTLIVPDKDADGLDGGVIIHRTLTALGLSPSLIEVHLLRKGRNIHDEEERVAMKAKRPKFIIVVDQGSRRSPPVVDDPETKVLVIDHHLSDEFPENTLVCVLYQLFVMGLMARRLSPLATFPLLLPLRS